MEMYMIGTLDQSKHIRTGIRSVAIGLIPPREKELPPYTGLQFDTSTRLFLEKNMREPIIPVSDASVDELTNEKERVFTNTMKPGDRANFLNLHTRASEIMIGTRITFLPGEGVSYDDVVSTTDDISQRWRRVYGEMPFEIITGTGVDYIGLSKMMQSVTGEDVFRNRTLWTHNPDRPNHPILLKEYKGQWFIGTYERSHRMGNISIIPLIIPVTGVK